MGLMDSKERLEARIKWLEIELIHRKYWDGWTVQGFEKELITLKKRLEDLQKENGND